MKTVIMPNITTREIKLKRAFLLAGKQVANKLGKSTGKQREDVDKAPIDGEFRAIYNNKIETV